MTGFCCALSTTTTTTTIQDHHHHDTTTTTTQPRPSSPPMHHHKRDRHHQEFSHFVGYLTEKQWADMKANPGESMELLVGHLIALGLMHPTEPTVQKMTAVMIMATQGAAGMHAMPPQALHESFKQIKKRTKTLKRTPQVYMLELPMSPDTYRKRYPDMYKALYQEQGPVHCPLSYPELAKAQELVPMRARKEGGPRLSCNP